MTLVPECPAAETAAFLDSLVEGTAFSRWGDGEWTAILGHRPFGCNCDGHPYAPELGRRLRAVLDTRPSYRLGLQPLATRVFPFLREYIAQHNWNTLKWVNADVLHAASYRGELAPFVARVLRAPGLLVVGPRHVLDLWQTAVPSLAGVVVPDRSCFDSYDVWSSAALREATQLPAGAWVLVSASMPAKLLVHELAVSSCGPRLIVIDCGSLWDYYAGRPSRRYMKALTRAGRPGPKAWVDLLRSV